MNIYPPTVLLGGLHHKATGAYYQFIPYIHRDEVNVIFEVGSRDALDAIQLHRIFNCPVYSFEPNPRQYKICYQNIVDQELMDAIYMVMMGVWDEDGNQTFHRIKDTNVGASSFFPFNPNASNYPDVVENGLTDQEIMDLPCMRLDRFLTIHGIDHIDLLCIDAEGATYRVLKSLGDRLNDVKYIICEVENEESFLGEVLFKDIDEFMTSNGFVRVSPPIEGRSGDVLYINSFISRKYNHIGN